MPHQLTEQDVISAIGVFLTLVGLIGTFFYIHLSTWFSDILQLRSKYELNRKGESETRKEARLECRYELRRLYNHVPVLVSSITAIFVAILTWLSLSMAGSLDPTPASFTYYQRAFIAFLLIYFLLTFYFLFHGYWIAHQLDRELNP